MNLSLTYIGIWKKWLGRGGGHPTLISMVVANQHQANMFVSNRKEKRCDVKQQIYEEKDLYICTFPWSDVFTYIETKLIVMDRDTNTTVYNRTVNVENHRKCYKLL